MTSTFAYPSTLLRTGNGDGHRVRKVADGVTTTYVIAVLGLPHVLVETTDGQSTAYLYGHDLLGEEGTTWAWHLNDGLGSVVLVTDDQGSPVEDEWYPPFGSPPGYGTELFAERGTPASDLTSFPNCTTMVPAGMTRTWASSPSRTRWCPTRCGPLRGTATPTPTIRRWSTPTRRGVLPGCRAANRLITVTNGTTLTLEYQYNGDGVLVAQTADRVTMTYVQDVGGPLSQILAETSGGQSTAYLYGHDLLAEEGGDWAWHLDDGLGSVRQLTDGSGEVTLAQGYTPFGVLLWRKGSAASAYGFTGEQEDAAVGLVFLRARCYDPATGSFLSKNLNPGSIYTERT